MLVRNPSYDAATDGLRDASPDRIQVRIGGDNDDLYNQVAAGTLISWSTAPCQRKTALPK